MSNGHFDSRLQQWRRLAPHEPRLRQAARMIDHVRKKHGWRCHLVTSSRPARLRLWYDSGRKENYFLRHTCCLSNYCCFGQPIRPLSQFEDTRSPAASNSHNRVTFRIDSSGKDERPVPELPTLSYAKLSNLTMELSTQAAAELSTCAGGARVSSTSRMLACITPLHSLFRRRHLEHESPAQAPRTRVRPPARRHGR